MLEFLAANNRMAYFNGIPLQHQVGVILIVEADRNTLRQMEQFIQAIPDNRHRALYSSAHRTVNSEVVFQEIRLGHIADFINYRASIGFPERFGLHTGPEPVGAQGGVIPQEGSQLDIMIRNIMQGKCKRRI